MSVATDAVIFSAYNAELMIRLSANMACNGLCKTRPTATAFIFVLALKQREIGCGTDKRAFGVVLIQVAASGFLSVVVE